MYISILYLFVLSASCIMMMLANKVLFYSIDPDRYWVGAVSIGPVMAWFWLMAA